MKNKKLLEKQVCPMCGKGKLKKEIVQDEFKYKGHSIIIPNYYIHKCDNCNEGLVDKETLIKTGRILKKWKREINKEEIRVINNFITRLVANSKDLEPRF